VAEQWFKLLLQFQEMLHSGILRLIIQHVTEDTKWKVNPQMPEGHVFSTWLESRQQTMEGEIAKAAAGLWINQIGSLSQDIFGSAAVNPLKYYNEKIAELFAAKGFEGFTYTEALNYLMAFLQQVFAKDIQEFCDLLTIRAQWSNLSGAHALSNGWNTMRTLMKRLDDFDNSLNNNGINGSRLIGALARLDRDRPQSRSRIIRQSIDEIDNEAMKILLEAADSLAGIAKIVESVQNDYLQTPHALIVNWREIEAASRRNISEWLKAVSDKLKKFVTLIRLLIGQ
jgi:uncharacterized protein YeeX (DUF496 family)